MDADTRALASKLLMDKAYSAPEVAEALTGSDYPVGRSAVGDWRRAHKVGQ
ncbi:hypothetical protein [Nakamurella lactea]|uniref:hypothetical protein n=1 Tax=Nakamurella lactea TaxID=459515 RepID=UPI0012B6511F|nr:hypothetical protein [Nakamurella lactea]